MEVGRAAAQGEATPGRRRALLLVNPASRRGAEAVRRMPALLEAAGVDARLGQAGSREEVGREIEAAASKIDCVVVGGGDGSLNAAVPALLRTGLPLGVLPLGTANDFARTLRIPADLRAAAQLIAGDRTRRVDVGLVNGLPFLNVASLGLSTELTERLTREHKRRWGRLSYAVAAAGVLARARPFRAIIVAKDAAVRVRTYQIAVGNGRYYGGGLPVRHDARADDGRLDLYSLEFPTLWRLALAARDFRGGRHGVWREVREFRCTRFQVRTRRPRPVNLDGELLTHTPARFELLPAALEVFAPD